MSKFKYRVKLTEGKEAVCEELTTKHQRVIAKTIMNDDLNLFLELMINVIDDLSSIDVSELNIIDLFIISCNMRAISVGPAIDMLVKDATGKSSKITVDINTVIKQLENVDISSEKYSLNNVVDVVLDPVKLSNIRLNEDLIYQVVSKFGNYDISELSLEETKVLIDNLGIKHGKRIKQYISKITESLSKVVIFEGTDVNTGVNVKIDIPFNTTYIVNLISTIFNINLHSIYRSIYYMVNVLKFSGEYVDEMSPVERGLYYSYYLKDQEESKKREEENQNQFQI